MYIIQVSKDLCKMVGYETVESMNNGENQGGQGVRRRQVGKTKPLSWGHLPNGGTVANLGNCYISIYQPSFYLTANFLFNCYLSI